jgi:hypothetical protein
MMMLTNGYGIQHPSSRGPMPDCGLLDKAWILGFHGLSPFTVRYLRIVPLNPTLYE